MATAATPGVRRPLRPAIAWVLGIAAGVLAVLTLGVFAIWFLVLALLPAVVLVPAGLVYGLISVVVLTARRARARREDDLSAIPAAADAMRFELPIQKVDRMVHVALLLLAVFGGGSVLLLNGYEKALSDQGYVFNNTTPLGNVLLYAGGVESAVLLVALAAIPVAAVLVTKELISKAQLAGEAYALEHRDGAYKRIRTSRILAWTNTVIYCGSAAWVIGVVVLQPR